MQEMVERKLSYHINVYPPYNVKDNENVTLHFKVEKVSMSGLERSSKDRVEMEGLGLLDADQMTANTKFTPPCPCINFLRSINLNRDVSSDDVKTQKLEKVPGSRFIWWYTGPEITPENYFYKFDEMTKKFVR